jgi:hypothetical protein
MLKVVDTNKAFLYYTSKIIAKDIGICPHAVRRFFTNLEFSCSCKYHFGKIDISKFSVHNFSMFLTRAGNFGYKRKPLMIVKNGKN